MKKIIITIFFLISLAPLFAQAFEYFPTTQRAIFKGVINDASIELGIRLADSGQTEHGRLTATDQEGHPFIELTYDNGGKMVLSKFEEDLKSEFSRDALSFIDDNTTRYKLGLSNGFQAYDNSGNVTVQIRGDVSGDGRVSTNELEITGGSDFSENFDVEDHMSSAIEPGMLVSIIGEEGKLALSSSKRDKRVVGIISGANGIETGMIMGQKGSIADGDYPIALSGRTYVYANTENGPIAPGDFITTSSTPGYGMKVNKYKKAQGAIVGKAMTSLKEGNGYVLVLVNLQ